MKKGILIGIITIVVIIAAMFVFNVYRPLNPAVGPVKGDIAELIQAENKEIAEESFTAENNTQFPLQLPEGISISVFAEDLEHARFMAFDQNGVLYLSQSKEGRIVALPDQNNDGKADEIIVIAEGLDRPHGLVFVTLPSEIALHTTDAKRVSMAVLPMPTSTSPFDEEEVLAQQAQETIPEYLYYAESGQVSRMRNIGRYAYSQPEVLISDIPEGGRHWTRTLLVHNDKLYVSTGSSCNVCEEADPHRAAVWEYDLDGSNGHVYASGVRNAVGMAVNLETNEIWVTENARDQLGDDIPPDEINVLAAGKDYGWPICYGNNIHDTDFDTNTYIRNPCEEPFTEPSAYDLPAHVAPLGMAFYTGGMFSEYKGDLFVALHGSWNRSVPVGYSIIRLEIENGSIANSHDFITGWLVSEQTALGSTSYASLGRPVDIVVGSHGEFYISDDKAGIVYRVSKVIN